MKYKVINSDLFLNGQLIPEGSTIELSESQSEGITSYLQPLEEKEIVTKTKKPVPNPVPNSFRDQFRDQRTKSIKKNTKPILE